MRGSAAKLPSLFVLTLMRWCVRMAVHGICVVMMDTAQFWQALQCAISFIEPFPATVNHEACVKKLQAAAAAGLKASFLQEPMRWSEDFGHYLQKTKGPSLA